MKIMSLSEAKMKLSELVENIHWSSQSDSGITSPTEMEDKSCLRTYYRAYYS